MQSCHISFVRLKVYLLELCSPENLCRTEFAASTPTELRWQRIRLQCSRRGFSPWVGKIPRRRKLQPSPVFLSGESHGQRRPVGYSPCGHSQTHAQTPTLSTHMHKHQRKGCLLSQRGTGWARGGCHEHTVNPGRIRRRSAVSTGHRGTVMAQGCGQSPPRPKAHAGLPDVGH